MCAYHILLVFRLPTVVRNSSMATLIDTMAEDDVITDPVDQQSLSSSACNHNDDTEFSEVPDSHCGSVATRYTGGARRITADMSSDSGSLVLPGRYRNKSGTSDDDKVRNYIIISLIFLIVTSVT